MSNPKEFSKYINCGRLVRFGPFRYVLNHGFYVKQAWRCAGNMHMIKSWRRLSYRKYAYDSFWRNVEIPVIMTGKYTFAMKASLNKAKLTSIKHP